MAKLSDAQRTWVDNFLGITGRANAATSALSIGQMANEFSSGIHTTGDSPNGDGFSDSIAAIMGQHAVHQAAPTAAGSQTAAAKKGLPKFARVTDHLGRINDEQRLEYDFGHPIAKEQAVQLIFQNGKLPSEARLEPGPGKNGWTLKSGSWQSTLSKMRARRATRFRGKQNTTSTSWEAPEPDVEVVEWTAGSPGGITDSPQVVKFDLTKPGRMELDFGRPMTKEQAAEVILYGGDVPDDVKFTQGPGPNGWTLQWDGPTRPQSLESRRRPINGTVEAGGVGTWTFNPYPVAGKTQRKDLKNEFGFKITRHYDLDEGQSPDKLVKKWKVGEGHGYEVVFEKPVTKDQVMEKLIDQAILKKAVAGAVQLKGIPHEPATIWQVHIIGVDAMAAVKPGVDVAFSDASVYAPESIAPDIPPGVRAHIENKTFPKDAKHHSPDVYVWEQEGYIVRVETDGKGKDGFYKHEATKLDHADEASKITMRYFMIEQGLPSRQAWQEYIKHWEWIHQQMLMALASALSSGKLPGRAPSVKPPTTPRRIPAKKSAPPTNTKPPTGSGTGHTGTTQKPSTGGSQAGGSGTTGKSTSLKGGGSGEKRKTPVKADNTKGHADDGDPGKATGKKGDPIKSDKRTADEGKAAKTTSGSKDSKNNAGKGDSAKSTGKGNPRDGAADGSETGKGATDTGSEGSPATGSGTKTPAPASKPLMSADELNQPVPQAERAKGFGPPRRLDAEERKNAKIVLHALEEMKKGNPKPFEQLGPLRPHSNTRGEFAGWYGVDLRPGNPGALNQMRIYFKGTGKGDFKVMLRQGH
jgi:hypothetical protein